MFPLDHPARRSALGDHHRRNAQHHLYAEAYLVPEPRLVRVYTQLNAAANQQVGALREHAIGHGDVTALLGTNSIEQLTVVFGVLKIGAAVTAINKGFTALERDHQIRSSCFTLAPQRDMPGDDDSEPNIGLDDDDVTLTSYTRERTTVPLGDDSLLSGLTGKRITMVAQPPTFYLQPSQQPDFGESNFNTLERTMLATPLRTRGSKT